MGGPQKTDKWYKNCDLVTLSRLERFAIIPSIRNFTLALIPLLKEIAFYIEDQ